MNNDVMLFLDRKELEFIKSEVVNAALDQTESHGLIDKEWVIQLAAKLIEACKKEDSMMKAIAESKPIAD